MRGGAFATLLLAAACTSPAIPGSAPTFASRTVWPSRDTGPNDRVRLSLSVDDARIASDRCASAAVSVGRGRPKVFLEWRSAGGRWRAWPAGPSRRIRHGIASIPVCPGWADDPVEVRAVAHGLEPSAPARVHVRAEPWMHGLEHSIGERQLSASVMVDGRFVYGHLAGTARPPASNEKLLLSMAELDRFGPDHRIPTDAASRRGMRHGVVRGDLYLVGHGDPELDSGDLHRLAIELRAAGLTRVQGGVVGDTGTFDRDRGAPGWHPIALRYVGLPTALSYRANVDASGFVLDPERRAAAALDAELRRLGVRIGAPPRAGDAPGRLATTAAVRSDRLSAILRRQNVSSINLDAETLSKGLATATLHRAGSIARGAHVIEGYANGLDAGVTLHDASGLSYRNRVTTASMAALLDDAQARTWGHALVASLPAPGEGTLGGRLAGVTVRAKTGTLIGDVSALSGYVRLRDGRWASFSIMSALPKDEAVALEDAIVRTIAAHA
jgi:D-alanyl-D-alanine carboxypeptidase